ncbi:GTPase ObgE [Candidatus Collierbacteria bacterium]|nr:GTPase ObgE [Candidatus Collierbacteria bacterium]
MVDSAKVTIKAGNGGDGVIHFYRGRFVPKGGPDGGDGGKGGNVYIETDTNLATLDHFAFRQKFEAASGNRGGESRSSGKAGEDLHIKVPLGTIARWQLADGSWQTVDFDRPGMEVLIARGGKGGRGNWHFRGPTNTTPIEAEPGIEGEEWQVEMDLKLLADVGLVGLPNVGKSTLLSILSNAKPKVADYEFTTLEPNLGVVRLGTGQKVKSAVIADIPGLIEGASEGKGLGIRFLRHVERTTLIVHLLALKSGEEDLSVPEAVKKLAGNYKTIRKELGLYAEELTKKKEIVALNKVDLLPAENLAGIVAGLAKKKIKVIALSAGNLSGLPELKKELTRWVKK